MNEYSTNHTFAVCAYKESPHLCECIESLINQTVKTNIIICTSTPNEYISHIATKYDISLYIKETPSDIQDDWNYAYNFAKTDYVTVAHQDDIYDNHYVEEFLKVINRYNDWSIFFSDYTPIIHGDMSKRDLNCRIRRLLKFFIKNTDKANRVWRKKSILRFGNSIVCPLVTYNKKLLGDSIFTSVYKFNLDWDTFLKLANQDGRFLYVDKVLGHFRIHDGATSKAFIDNRNREIEDMSMFEKFWPKWFSKFIMIFYVKAYNVYLK